MLGHWSWVNNIFLFLILMVNLMPESFFNSLARQRISINCFGFVNQKFQKVLHHFFIFYDQEHISLRKLNGQALPWVEWHLSLEKFVIHMVKVLPEHPPLGSCSAVDKADDPMELKAGIWFDQLDLFDLDLLINQIILLKSVLLEPLKTFQVTGFRVLSLPTI